MRKEPLEQVVAGDSCERDVWLILTKLPFLSWRDIVAVLFDDSVRVSQESSRREVHRSRVITEECHKMNCLDRRGLCIGRVSPNTQLVTSGASDNERKTLLVVPQSDRVDFKVLPMDESENEHSPVDSDGVCASTQLKV